MSSDLCGGSSCHGDDGQLSAAAVAESSPHLSAGRGWRVRVRSERERERNGCESESTVPPV